MVEHKHTSGCFYARFDPGQRALVLFASTYAPGWQIAQPYLSHGLNHAGSPAMLSAESGKLGYPDSDPGNDCTGLLEVEELRTAILLSSSGTGFMAFT